MLPLAAVDQSKKPGQRVAHRQRISRTTCRAAPCKGTEVHAATCIANPLDKGLHMGGMRKRRATTRDARRSPSPSVPATGPLPMPSCLLRAPE